MCLFLVVESAGEIQETFINGGGNMSDPGVYQIGGTDFVYSRNNNSEKILARGPTKEGIVIKVFGYNPWLVGWLID